MTPATERERRILDLAESLLISADKESALDEASVDAEFLFRFEVSWCASVTRIRARMRALLGEPGDDSLSDEQGARWLVHLEENVGLRVGMELEHDETHYLINNSQGSYHILDKTLREKEEASSRALSDTTQSQAERKKIWEQVWMEANQTSKVQSELESLIRAYRLVPTRRELEDYPSRQVKQQYASVRNWTLWGQSVPALFYEKTLLIEIEVNTERQTIRPSRWPKNRGFSKERLPLTARIRTWAIYYLTLRGGGTLDETAAVTLWNDRFPRQRVEPVYYEDNRIMLFTCGSAKGLAPSLATFFDSVYKRWAVLVGVNEYDDRELSSLRACVKDATAISQSLVSGGFGSNCVRLITDSTDYPPTRTNILSTLQSIADETTPDDLLLFYFSGHGMGSDGESYLLPKDVDLLVMADTALPIARIKSMVANASARAKVIVLDACHSGAKIHGKGDRRMSEAFVRSVFEQAEGIAILSSCKQGEKSYEWQERGQGVFTHFLLKALSGESDRDGKGFVTVQDTNLYVLDRVKQWATRNKVNQTPTFEAATVGDIPLVRYAK